MISLFKKTIPPLSIALFWALVGCGTPQQTSVKAPSAAIVFDSLRIGFYNVENLFDTYDDPVKIDSEFLPTSQLKWTMERYLAKQKNIEKVIEFMQFPSIMGFCEIENKRVLEDLAAQPKMQMHDYGIVHYDSPDDRGIDVGLMYKKADFKVLSSKSHPVVFADAPIKTRDVLEVTGQLRGQTVTVFVNHFPSRRGGQDESASRRIAAAAVVRKAVDSIFQKDKTAAIIIMGDLNDTPTDISISETLNAKNWANEDETRSNALYNLGFPVVKRNEGTIFYKGWSVFDQIIVSGSFLQKSSALQSTDAEVVVNPDFVTFTDKAGNKTPSRTYTGPIYRGGFSDHFAVYVPVFVKRP